MTNVIRVSKTSFKQWDLYGDLDDALRTSCQAENVKCVPIHLDEVHDVPVDVELWINADEASTDMESHDELNPTVQAILRLKLLREQGGDGSQFSDDQLPVIKGVGVLTGPNRTDFPEENTGCILGALVGRHE